MKTPGFPAAQAAAFDKLFYTWPLEESLSHEAMRRVSAAIALYLGKRWPMPDYVQRELENTRNVIDSMLERETVPADSDLLK